MDNDNNKLVAVTNGLKPSNLSIPIHSTNKPARSIVSVLR